MTGDRFRFPRVEFGPEERALREEVRGFIREERASGGFTPMADSWGSGWSPEWSRKMGERGWLGMMWPKEYGGGERPALHRYIVTEEMVSAGAPCAAHWVADRQSGPLLLRYGTEEQRRSILPRIAAGECYFAIGMSEPDSGSDLASVRTTATKVDGGWTINGRKIWSSGAHRSHYMIALVRTAPRDMKARHAGLTQFLIDLKSPGIEIRGIRNIAGERHFNETVFDDAFVPDDMVIGEAGDGWRQVTSELAIERSGPERFLSTFPVLTELVRELGPEPGERDAETVGALAARTMALRRMSLGISRLLDEGEAPEVAAALVKDMGTRFEGELVREARNLLPAQAASQSPDLYGKVLADGVLHVPSSTIRGGTNEVLKGIVARELGLR